MRRLAEVYNSMGKQYVLPKDCIPLAKAAATRALEIDPMLAEGHSALADSLATYDWNWAESESHFNKALELDPNVSYTHLAYGISYLSAMGRRAEMVKEAERAVELEPLSLINNSVLTSAYIYDRKYDKALVQARRTYDLDPNFPMGRVWLGFALIENGRYDEAISSIGQVSPDSPFGLCRASYSRTRMPDKARGPRPNRRYPGSAIRRRTATFGFTFSRIPMPRSVTRTKRLPNSNSRSQKGISFSAGSRSILLWIRYATIHDSKA